MISKQKVNIYLQNFIERIEKDGLLEEVEFIFTYGSTTSGVEYVPNINVGIIVTHLSGADLKKWQKTIRYMVKRGKTMPLLMPVSEFLGSSDVFPIEYLDMKLRHFKLYGKDVLGDLELDLSNIRLRLEEELRAKYVRMREIFLSPHSKTLLKRVLSKALSSLNILLKAMVYIQLNKDPKAFNGLLSGKDPQTVIREFSGKKMYEFLKLNNGLDLVKLSSFYDLKYNNKKIEIDDKSFIEVIDEWARLVEFIDKEKI
ncbi:hypothetical protein KAI78_00830 [bacterium]|nr:hypothetical protein [bacterium]